jgi:hypothetical protein
MLIIRCQEKARDCFKKKISKFCVCNSHSSPGAEAKLTYAICSLLKAVQIKVGVSYINSKRNWNKYINLVLLERLRQIYSPGIHGDCTKCIVLGSIEFILQL